MRSWLNKLVYAASTTLFGLLALLFLGVAITSLAKNAIGMYDAIGFNWRLQGNYAGLIVGFLAYGAYAVGLFVMRMKHNLDWFMKFTHELTHTLIALIFLRKIYEFVVRGKECYVSYQRPRLGYLPITLSPYCIPIYTFMLFPFRFAGDDHYMIIFDVLIAFTYAFHIHSFIRQTRFTQSDIENCGVAQSITFLSFAHFAVLALILAIPRGGVLNALNRVFWEYPLQIISDPWAWAHEIVHYFMAIL